MSLLFSSYIKNPPSVCFDGEDHDETILLTLRKHFVTNLKWIFLSTLMFVAPSFLPVILELNGVANLDMIPTSYKLIGGLFWYLMAFGYFFTSFLIWFFSVYLVSNKRVIDVDFNSFLHRRFSEASLNNIEDLTNQMGGLWQVIFRYGTLNIQTAGEMRELEFEDIPNPTHVQDFISDLVLAKKNGRAKND